MGRLVEIYRPWEKPGAVITEKDVKEIVVEIEKGIVAEREGKRSIPEPKPDRP